MTKKIIVYADPFAQESLASIKKAFHSTEGEVEVWHGATGKEALMILEVLLNKGTLPCLVVLSKDMPLMDGRQTAIRIRSHRDFRDLPIVMLTKNKGSEDQQFSEAWDVEMVTRPSSKNLERTLRPIADRSLKMSPLKISA
jgi:CheY-like chemotaxis protein